MDLFATKSTVRNEKGFFYGISDRLFKSILFGNDADMTKWFMSKLAKNKVINGYVTDDRGVVVGREETAPPTKKKKTTENTSEEKVEQKTEDTTENKSEETSEENTDKTSEDNSQNP